MRKTPSPLRSTDTRSQPRRNFYEHRPSSQKKRPERDQRTKRPTEKSRRQHIQPIPYGPTHDKYYDTPGVPHGRTVRIHRSWPRVPRTESRDPATTPSVTANGVTDIKTNERFSITISNFSETPICLPKGTVVGYAKRNPLAIDVLPDKASRTLDSVLHLPFDRTEEVDDTEGPQTAQPEPIEGRSSRLSNYR